jgi:hypothetical protein
MSLKKKLKQFQDNWETSMEEGFGKFPKGTWKFQLQNAEIVESQSSGRLQIHREHLCIDGEPAGNVLHDYLQLQTEKGPRFVMQWVEQMGHEVPERMEDLEEVVEAIAEAAPIYMALVKHSGDFVNLSVTQLLAGESEKAEDEDEDEDEEEPDTPEDEDDDDDDDEDSDDEDDDSDDDDEDETLEELKALAQACELDVDEDDDLETLLEKMKDFEIDESELMPEEVELMKRVGLGDNLVKPKPKKSKKGKKKDKPKKKSKDKKKKSKGKGKKKKGKK